MAQFTFSSPQELQEKIQKRQKTGTILRISGFIFLFGDFFFGNLFGINRLVFFALGIFLLFGRNFILNKIYGPLPRMQGNMMGNQSPNPNQYQTSSTYQNQSYSQPTQSQQFTKVYDIKYCEQCGTQNDAETSFCVNCGTKTN